MHHNLGLRRKRCLDKGIIGSGSYVTLPFYVMYDSFLIK